MAKKKPITAEQICSEFYFQFFRVCKGRYIDRQGPQYEKAMNDEKKMGAFQQCADVINEQKLDYVEYIGNTFTHYKKYVHPKTLINPSNLIRYRVQIEEKDTAKQTTYIYEQLVKSVRFVALHCKMNDFETVHEFFNYCVRHDTLGAYLMSGKVSKYYLAMFTNIEMIIGKMQPDSRDELRRVVMSHKGQLDQNARNAIMTFTGSKKASIIQITNHNINKVIGE